MVTTAIHIEGNLISADFIPEILGGEIKGQQSQDFGLKATDNLEDEIAFIWSEAKSRWAIFQGRLARLAEEDSATSLTREYWGIPLLELLGYQPSYQGKAEVIDNQTFAVSHRAGIRENAELGGEIGEEMTPPIHVIGCRLSLEKRPPSGTPRLSAHGLVQEFLNRTEHLWGITTNGHQWRLLRDCSLMTRLAYIEFDLEQIFNNENFAEFRLFYRLFHRSRLSEGMEDSDRCLLEHYYQETLSQGGRVRDNLRDGVEDALKILGNGFLQHPKSESLRQSIANGELAEGTFYRQLLMLIYRCLFLMVAESRNLLLAGEDAEKIDIYNQYYSFSRLREIADRPNYRREGFEDLWQGLQVTFSLFDESWRGEILGLSPLNGDLFGSKTLAQMADYGIDNHDLLKAIRGLSLYSAKGLLRRVNYAALDVEELGSVYESLLDFTPQISIKQGIYQFDLVTGSDRKTTGSYYTPSELVAQLIKSALEPVIEERLKDLEEIEVKQHALLSLKICDPACGSGHFLLAAARRVGKELARVRTGEIQPSPEPLRQAIRDVIQHCIYGVDLNPLAVDLCKVALWIEGFCKGMPLNFLDHRIKCGNSLVGLMDLEVLKEGIPDNAYTAVTGDDKVLATKLKKSNKLQCKVPKGQLSLFEDIDFDVRQGVYAKGAQDLDTIEEVTPEGYKRKQQRYEALRSDGQWWQDYSACNLWTAAFFMPLTEQNLQLLPTTEALRRLLKEAEQREQRDRGGQGSLFESGETSSSTPFGVVQIVEAAKKLGDNHHFFHWCLEFPEVFEKGGFDCVLGNPPWERFKLLEKEFFGNRNVEIAEARNKIQRIKLIKDLEHKDFILFSEWKLTQHNAEAESKFIRESGRFPKTGFGEINTYALFAETSRQILANGLLGIIVPTGIATDNNCKYFFGDLVKTKTLNNLYDFENREAIFFGVHRSYKFSLLGIAKKTINKTKFAFFLTKPKQLEDQRRIFSLEPDDILLFNPNTLTCPVFRTYKDAELTQKIYKNFAILDNEKSQENCWGIYFSQGLFNMSHENHLFEEDYNDKLLPIYEGKMIHQFDHRWSNYIDNNIDDVSLNEKKDPHFIVKSRYWIDPKEIKNKLADKWNRDWLLGFRDVTNSSNERTAIFSLLPKVGIANNIPIIFMDFDKIYLTSCLLANFNSLIFDFVARQKVGGSHLNFFIVKQLPVIPPEAYTPQDIEFISKRVLELTYTAYDLKPFAEDMGYFGEPFIWDENRRAILRAELDAKYAKLYGLTRDELRYILDPADVYGPDFPSETFRVLKNNEIKKYGEYRTRKLVLAAWDMMGY